MQERKRAFLTQVLAQAERHILIGEGHVSEQRRLIDELERDGHDVTSAKELLATFEESLWLHVQHRDRLRKELSDAEGT